MSDLNTITPELQFSHDSRGLLSLIDFLRKRAFQNPNRSLQLIEEGLKVSNKFVNEKYRLDLLSFKGAILIQKGLFPHALDIFEEALDIAQRLKDEISISRILNNIGLIYKAQEKYSEALETYYKSLKYSESKQNPYIYSNIGSILYIQKDLNKALQYFTNALYLAEKHNDVQILCVCCINIGDFHKEKGNYPKAIEFLERGLTICEEKAEFILHRGIFLQSIGKTFFLMKSYEEALDYILRAREIFKTHGFYLNQVQCLNELADVYIEKDDYNEAIQILTTSSQICDEQGYYAEKIDALHKLTECYEETSNSQKSIATLKELVAAQNQHFTKEGKQKFKDLLQNKENEIDVLIRKNQQIERQNTLLEESNKELKQYAYIIAHDLKEPLRNINSFTNLLAKFNRDQFTDDSKEFMKIVEQNASVMSQKLDDLLGYVALKMDPEKLELVDVEVLVYKVLNVLQRELNDNKMMLQIDKLPNLYITPSHLRLLFYHLIKNAIEYIDETKDFHSININCTDKSDHLEFCIEDNGIGISKAYHKKIFMIFKQLSKNYARGTGIGLAICEKIVRLYQGKIWVESKEKEGTKVFFTIKKFES
ncbi:MAG: tetratricopeptide repeat protein [Bacteroidia bacterium]|nr:tetratricopeptide repeat protein [Bacteroidia bacterium]